MGMAEKEKILIADHSVENCAVLADILWDDYAIETVTDGQEAVELLARGSYQYTLVLLDLMMPKVDGFTLLTQMKRHHWMEEIPVIVTTAGLEKADVRRVCDLGVSDFIQPPYDEDVVRQRVKNTIRLYARERNMSAVVAEQYYENEKNSGMMTAILSSIAEYQNGESGLHIMRIRTITRQLLQQVLRKTNRYHFSAADIPLICNAAALHDIGKIAIPNQILNKPGRLTPEEFNIVKTHSKVGADILQSLPVYRNEPLVKTAYRICHWHHERWDGGGYPDGLVGEEIPIETQVVSLADVYDALTSQRCYKPAYSHRRAVEMILRGECGAFNPLLLDCMLELDTALQQSVETTDAKERESRMQNVLNVLSSCDGLSMPRDMVQRFAVHQRTMGFLLDHMEYPCFFYRYDPSVVELSHSAGTWLDVEEIVVDPEHNEALLHSIRQEDIQTMMRRARAASPDDGDFTVDARMRLHGEEIPCTLHCRNIWYADSAELWGTVGLLQMGDTPHLEDRFVNSSVRACKSGAMDEQTVERA